MNSVLCHSLICIDNGWFSTRRQNIYLTFEDYNLPDLRFHPLSVVDNARVNQWWVDYELFDCKDTARVIKRTIIKQVYKSWKKNTNQSLYRPLKVETGTKCRHPLSTLDTTVSPISISGKRNDPQSNQLIKNGLTIGMKHTRQHLTYWEIVQKN